MTIINQYKPWYNIDQINFIENKKDALKNYFVFEYGSGYSTLYFSTFAKMIFAAESRQVWFDKISNELKTAYKEYDYIAEESSFAIRNVTLFLVQKEFAKSINTLVNKNVLQNSTADGLFIVVDSNDRVNCIKESYNFICSLDDKIKRQSIIMIDNCERENLKSVIEYLKNNGMFFREFCGIRPLDDKKSISMLFCFDKLTIT
jgi:hypothetical protein